jgi:hypothetical protein
MACLGLAGCPRQANLVFVDVQQVVLLDHRETPAVEPIPEPPDPLPALSARLPALERRVVGTGVTQERLQEARQVIRENQRQAYQDLLRAFQRAATREGERLAAQMLLELEPIRLELREQTAERIRSAFEQYAEQKGPLLARLAALVGFPDPDPQSLRQSTEVRYFPPRHEEAREVRAQLAAVEKKYDAMVAQIMADIQAQFDVDLTRVQAQIEQMRQDLHQQAVAEATRQVQRAQEELTATLVQREIIVVPPEPARIVEIPAGQRPERVPTLAPQIEAEPGWGPAEIVESDLEIYLAVNGYIRSTTRRGARDVTAEFIEWRRARVAGP